MEKAMETMNGMKKEYVVTPEYITTSFRAAEERRKRAKISPSDRRRYLKALRALEKTSQLLAIETHIGGILKNIAETIGKALGAKYVNFWNFTEDKKGVFIITSYGMQRQYILHSRKNPLPVGSAWIGRAMKTGQAWATSNVQKDPFLPKSWLSAVRKQDYHGLLCAPLIKKSKIVGGMCVYYERPHVFEYDEMSLATIVANQAATAMENARIFGDLTTERTKTLSIIQSLGDGLIMFDLEGRAIFFNPKAEDCLSIAKSSIIGRKAETLQTAGNDALKNLGSIMRLMQRDYETKEYVIEHPRRMVLAVTQIPVHDNKKKKIGTMLVLHDITREKDIELLKIRFISTASHQLRTPLTGIKWSLEYITKQNIGALNPMQSEMLQKTFKASARMVALVDDLLDTSKIEEGKYGYAFAMGDIAAVVEEVAADSQLQCEENNIRVELKLPDGRLPPASFDREKIKIALANILENAIQYSPRSGKVRIYARAENGFLFITVEDGGIGIPEEDKKFVFNKFFRAKNAIRTQTEGSGLGLFITKSIVEKHNGSLSFESQEHKGTSFTVQLPLDPKKMPRGVIKDR